MFAKISSLCLLVAAGLFVWSGNSRQDGDELTVENQVQALGEQTLGGHTLELCVRNNSSQLHRVIGMTGH